MAYQEKPEVGTMEILEKQELRMSNVLSFRSKLIDYDNTCQLIKCKNSELI